MNIFRAARIASSIWASFCLSACYSILAGITPGTGGAPRQPSRLVVADAHFSRCSDKALERHMADPHLDDGAALVEAALSDCAAEEAEFMNAEIAESGDSEGRARFAQGVDFTRRRLQQNWNNSRASSTTTAP